MRCVLTRLYLFIPRQQAANWGLEMFGLNLVNDPMQKLDLFWKMTVILYSCPLQPYAETQWGLHTHTFLFLKLSFSDIRIWNHFSCSRSHKYQITFWLLFVCLYVCFWSNFISPLLNYVGDLFAWKISAHQMNVLQSYEYHIFLVIQGKLYKTYWWVRIKCWKFDHLNLSTWKMSKYFM